MNSTHQMLPVLGTSNYVLRQFRAELNCPTAGTQQTPGTAMPDPTGSLEVTTPTANG